VSEWKVGSHLAWGATAEITRGAPGVIVKTFYPEFAAGAVLQEASGSATAHAAGVPSPQLVSVDPASGVLEFAYVPGKTLDIATFKLGARRTGHVLAELLDSIASVARTPGTGGDIPDVKSRMLEQVDAGDAPRELKAAARADLEGLPAGDSLLHLDLHMRNVMWDGTPCVIDWSNAAWGPPAADISRTRLLLAHSHFYVPRAFRLATRRYLVRVSSAFEEHWVVRAPAQLEASRAWDRVFAAARFDGPVAQVEKDFIASSWTRGQRTVKGPGPRDTHG